MSKTHNAGIVTAYGAAVRGGYTGTYEEFCAQQAQYAENARQMEQAVSDVKAIKTSVESAVSVAETHATNASQSATNASNSATQASESASNASQSAESASQFADNASSSANSASQSATSAQTSANNASTSEQNARQSAEDAQDVLASVQTEGDTQIGRVQAKGDEIINYLPEDFTEVQQELTALNGSLGTLIDVVPADTASGVIASFNDGADDIPVKNLTVNIEPIQSGTGDPSPDNVRPISGWTGVNVVCVERNLWDEEWELGSYSNANGEPTTYPDRIRSKNGISVVPNTEYFFKTSNGLTAGNVYFYDVNDVFISARTTIGNTAIVTPDNCRYMRIAMGLPYGATYNNDVSINYPSSDHEYHPYVGTSVNIDWSDEAGTVYGGTLDVTNGKLTVDMAMVDLGTLNWTNTYVQSESIFTAKTNKAGVVSNKTLCSAYLYSGLSVGANRPDKTINMGVPYFDSQKTTVSVKDTSYSDATVFKTAMSGVQLVYELANPVTYQLTPNEVKTILGENNIFADTGDVSVEYRADIKKYIDKVVATAVSAFS